MSTEENKALARRIIEEAWNQGNLVAVDELMSPDYAGHHSLVPKQPPSRELYKQFIVRTRTAFPDMHATIEDQVAEGDLVVTRWSVQGTHGGMFRGHGPTGKRMTVTGITIERFVNGKSVEGWMEMDTLDQMQQLGVMPQPGQPS
jgi:predicted ester cyclase